MLRSTTFVDYILLLLDVYANDTIFCVPNVSFEFHSLNLKAQNALQCHVFVISKMSSNY